MKIAESHFARAAIATMWNYSGRLVGLGWTAMLISKLGIADFGAYSMGASAAAITNAALDNAFYVRSLRIDDARFERERCARVIFGTVVAAVGILIYPESYVAGFAIIIAAGELFFNTFKSQYLRVGRPDTATRFDAIRQFSSIGLAAGYMFLAADPQLATASLLYAAPYAVIMAACFRYVPNRSPAMPGDLREISILSSEACAAAVYMQGDLLVLGLLVNETVAGYYSVALVTTTAVSLIGQQYATTFVEHLRASGGDLDCAPRPMDIVKVAALAGSAVAIVGIGILLWGRADEVGYLTLIMSLLAAGRAVEYNLAVILFAQRRDALRARTLTTLAVVKLALFCPVVLVAGPYGGAAIGVMCEIAVVWVYYRALYRQPRHRPVTEEIRR
jgi:O-antigen/teichoic acid export membrane protein